MKFQIHINQGTEWNAELKTNKINIKFKLDTGAQVNCLPLRVFEKLKLDKNLLNKNNRNLITYSGDKLDTVGTCFLKCLHNNVEYLLEFYVVNVKTIPLLGIEACQALNLIKKVSVVNTSFDSNLETGDIINKYKDLFEGIGLLKIKPIKLTVKETAEHVVYLSRKVPYAIQGELKAELDRLEKMQIIKKVTEPTEWINSLVVVRKSNGKLRICLDPKDLNKNIKREYFQMPTIDDIASKI